MKRYKKILSLALAFCLLLSVLPMQWIQAAKVVQCYELDTDGIDAGADYLIVSAGSATDSATALRFYYGGWYTRDFQKQSNIVIYDGADSTYIDTGFTNEANCQFQFSSSTSGRINYGEDYAIDLNDEGYTQYTPGNTLTFTHVGNGAYRIHYTSGWYTYYLRYDGSNWEKTTTASTVYLFKLTERVISHDVTYNGNGYTEGTLPADSTDLDYESQYTVLEPTALRKDDADDNSWLFLHWNTAADGSGTSYHPGDVITITGDVTLYAQWYPVVKYDATIVTMLNGEATDVEDIGGINKTFYAKLEGSDEYLLMKQTAIGTYTAKVEDNGTYVIYAKVGDGDYEPLHGHQVTIYNENSMTQCIHYSVSHNLAGGAWPEGMEPEHHPHHAGEAYYAPTVVPILEGNRFLGWEDTEGNLYQPGYLVTASIDKEIQLTAKWEETVDVTVNVTIDHNSVDGGEDNADNKAEVTFDVMRTDEQGYNQVIGTITLTVDDHGQYVYTFSDGVSTYEMPDGVATFGGLQQGDYTVSLTKSYYEGTVESTKDADGNTTIQVSLQYAPTNFDLNFDVVVEDWENVPQHLRPQAANVKVTYWGYNAQEVLGWHIITQQENGNPPVTVTIDPETGRGSGFYPVWKYWGDTDNIPYYYRVMVNAYIMPDGTLAPATEENHTTYTAGIYTGTVSIVPAGGTPDYPDNSDTDLQGAQYSDALDQQDSVPTVTVAVTPYTVTFAAEPGTVNGVQTLVMTDQYRYPDLYNYVAVPNTDDRRFICWLDQEGNPATNQNGELLTGDIIYTARYNENVIISGDLTVDTTYMQNGAVVTIAPINLPQEVMVVLQKKTGNVYNDVASQRVAIDYSVSNAPGTGSYKFENVPNDGTEYRIYVRTLNYDIAYDNNGDTVFTGDEFGAVITDMTIESVVDAHLLFNPAFYQQAVKVDSTQIHEDLRPTDALVQILYRDLGAHYPYDVISQHTVSPFGIPVAMHDAVGLGFEDVWNYHTNGTLYEYQAQVSTLYGNNVAGAYTEAGLPYDATRPFTIKYGNANNYFSQTALGGVMLTATLVPKEYAIHLDLNLGEDTATPVYGLESYMMDDDGAEKYVYMHTWSYGDQFVAFPYREGYVFTGWTIEGADEDMKDKVYITETGVIHVGATLAEDVTLTANWEKLEGTDYTIRYLELNTDVVLKGSQVVRGVALGSQVVAADQVASIPGYEYAGAMVNGFYMDKFDNPVLTVSNTPTNNTLVIYYLPDGSDGYTEQVESNLNIDKTAILEDNGTYTITLSTHTKDNPITTLIQQNTPLDIVLVLDQSGSLAANDFEYLTALQNSVTGFVNSVAEHGRYNRVDHRIAMVGFAGNETDIHSADPVKATGGKTTESWINTGVFDSNGEFHLYNYKGFTYTLIENAAPTADGLYYTKVTEDGQDHYLLLTHHDEYRHLITEEEARVAILQGEAVFGYIYNEQNVGSFVPLTRNSSGLWLYGDKKLYSGDQFFTYHADVWTHRHGLDAREIHAYGVGENYTPIDGHEGVYSRSEVETTGDQSIYKDALVPVSLGANGSGDVTPGLATAIAGFGADGATRSRYGMELANEILAANPIDPASGRIRLVVMFTDGEPGYMGFEEELYDGEYYQQAVEEANAAISNSYVTKNSHDAYVYAIGLYESGGVEATSDVAYYMNALSSNYPNAQNMDDIKAAATYQRPASGTELKSNGKFFYLYNGTYYEIKYGYVATTSNYRQHYCWYYTRGGYNREITTTTNPDASAYSNIYQKIGGYQPTEYSGYYATTDSATQLQSYFENVLADITTKITTEIELNPDTILRDIMNQGLVLTDGTVITAYKQAGWYDAETGDIIWSVDENGQPVLEYVASLDLDANTLRSEEIADIKDEHGNIVKQVPYIQVYNYGAANPTDPNGEEYHPHTVDITGYDFTQWYINETHTKGYKMVVTITRVEARDNVEWGRSTSTNHEQSGLWLPEDEFQNRELLLPFDQPTTIFVERAYVLDYGKEFTLSGWYFDDEEGKEATPVHVDCDIESGMNWFDPDNPTQTNVVDGVYGNTRYGNVQVHDDGTVTYCPTTMNWGGYDQFYIFGDTWRKTVLAQDANENGNLWNKVTVIPANNIYYEDSFITPDAPTGSEQNDIDGFTFTGAWEIIEEDNAHSNTEVPEHLEGAPYGDVHGWTGSLDDDVTFTDGSAHFTDTPGASTSFTFTGTGVDVYTRTNAQSGMVVAVLNRQFTLSDGSVVNQFVESIAMDNLAVSGDYYHIPTISFKELAYGTYTVQLIATMASTATDTVRYEYYLDGVRVYNPLGGTTNNQPDIVKDAYGMETNAVFTEVRDVLLDYGDFNSGMTDDTAGIMGAVFIDWIQEGQESGGDTAGVGVPTYELGTFEKYGPKNEVYLSAGQAIVLKVDESNTYYVGLKSLTGGTVTANVSGITQGNPTQIEVTHTTDMYYQITPVDGYIVIQNGNTDEAILSITKLRATNLNKPAANGGILPIAQQEAVAFIRTFDAYMRAESENTDVILPPPAEDDEEEIPSADQQAETNLLLARALFTTVRQWLEET